MDIDNESITVEEKQRLQKDAGIPHLPTDLTYKLRMAMCGENKDDFFSYDYMWTDKPHRLVYDACREIERQQSEIEQLRKALRMWVRFWEEDDDDVWLAEKAMEETYSLLRDDNV